MQIADTSALYALYSENDAHHETAKADFAKPDSLIVPSEVLAETLGLIQKRNGFEAAAAVGESIRRLENVEIRGSTEQILSAAWPDFVGAKGKLSYVDAIVIAWARRNRAVPLSFDREILGRAGILP